jgi:hypothetical protein
MCKIGRFKATVFRVEHSLDVKLGFLSCKAHSTYIYPISTNQQKNHLAGRTHFTVNCQFHVTVYNEKCDSIYIIQCCIKEVVKTKPRALEAKNQRHPNIYEPFANFIPR